MQTITMTRPDDWHLHLRDGRQMADILEHTAARFARAIVMPNLKPPVSTVQAALSYRQRIINALPAGMDFTPLMTLYLTDNTTVEELHKAVASEHVYAVKLYPAGATTNSDAGVTDIGKIYDALEYMQEAGMPLLVHGELIAENVDIFDREKVFIDSVLEPLTVRFPALRIVFEHITTRSATDFVLASSSNIAATITPHHLLHNRNEIFHGGINPHYYCLPILKREADRTALLSAATSGNPKFFLGTDSAPHARSAKESDCGCAGIYSAHAALEFYAEVFDAAGALDRLEGFASFFGADFYGLPRNETLITLRRESWEIPDDYPFGGESVIPLHAGSLAKWRIDSRG